MPELFGSEFRLDPTRPIYLQIIERFQEAVARGVLQPGDQIPAQRELAQRIGVNPNTVQRAYREMEVMGLVETARGTGTFITLDAGRVRALREDLARQAVAEFVRRLQDLGFGQDEIVRRVAAALGTPVPGAGDLERGSHPDDPGRAFHAGSPGSRSPADRPATGSQAASPGNGSRVENQEGGTPS
ncbi:GntR family transcriptional regulator [Thermaerobacter sp. PB12/4term]|uniref:GntR family transcriptional regulator n=1 Tax=Thermaerobacter sp. PB12/4term TaxID=2293838 RepID=UPI000E327895|nr:GntR family transcriptional regulator [Thermaerobacter sp. PB12/4term]QIA27564.1 GntR family transcriptional regulator [Thermaerobacter sp. PB12/4term]